MGNALAEGRLRLVLSLAVLPSGMQHSSFVIPAATRVMLIALIALSLRGIEPCQCMTREVRVAAALADEATRTKI